MISRWLKGRVEGDICNLLSTTVAQAKFPQLLLSSFHKVKYSRVFSEKTWKHSTVPGNSAEED